MTAGRWYRAIPAVLLASAVASWIVADRMGSTPLRWAGGLSTAAMLAVSLVAIAAWFPRPVGIAIPVGVSAVSAIALITLIVVELWPGRLGERVWNQPLQSVIGGLLISLGVLGSGLTCLKASRGRIVGPGMATALILAFSLLAWFGGGLLLGSSSTASLPGVEFVPDGR